MRSLAVLVVAYAVARPALADPAFTCPSPANPPPSWPQGSQWKVLEDVTPFQRWWCLDGEVVGILSDYDGQARDVLWGRMPGPLEPHKPSSYLFTTGDDSPRAPYFVPPVAGESATGIGFDDASKKSVSHKASTVSRATGTPLKLVKDAHLVRIGVNDGRGTVGNVNFFITSVTVLDGQKGYPASVSELMHRTIDPREGTTGEGKRWRDLVRAKIAQDTARDVKVLAPFGKPKELVEAGHRVTWFEARRVLRVTFYGRISTEYHAVRANPDPHAGTPWCSAPKGADCAPRMIPRTLESKRTYAGEYAVEVEYGADGKQLSAKEHPVGGVPVQLFDGPANKSVEDE